MTAEKNTIQYSGAVAYGPEGKRLWPAQPPLDIGDGPEQVYRDVPADWDGYSHAARAMAEGWQPPLPMLVENIRQREALRMACRRVEARRLRDESHVSLAVRRAADLLEEDPAGVIVDAIAGYALDRFCQSIGTDDSIINRLSWQLEKNWRQLCFDHQGVILRSLVGRDSPAANSVRHYVESLAGLLKPPDLGPTEWVIRLT